MSSEPESASSATAGEPRQAGPQEVTQLLANWSQGDRTAPEQTSAILDVDEALEKLAVLDSRKAHVVELRYFGGLNQDEIAEVLKISTVTVRRDWVFARAWLYTELHSAA